MQEVVILNKIKKVWRPTKKLHGPPVGRGPPVEKHWCKGHQANLVSPHKVKINISRYEGRSRAVAREAVA